MSALEIFLIAVGLAMDAFAVSIVKGLSVPQMKARYALICGLYFGVFQFLMPVIGYLAGSRFADAIAAYDHWIAFILLLLIGLSMIRESRDKEIKTDPDFGIRTMVLLAIATSIDALAVGVSFAFLQVKLLPAVTTIGVVAFCLSAAGVKIGAIFGARYKSRAELAGGFILIAIGLKILLEHLGVL